MGRTRGVGLAVRCGAGFAVLGSLATAAVTTPARAAQETRAASTVVALVDVNVVPLDTERVVTGQTVVVEGERITAVGPNDQVRPPAGARVIAGGGRYLVPGLAEMHAHLPSAQTPPAQAEDLLFLYVANGVTTVRGMQGDPSQLALRRRAEAGELIAPRMIVGSPAITGQSVATAADGERLVREHAAAGFDLIKVHEGLTREVYDAIAATAREIGIPFGGHVADAVGLLHALEAGQATIDHLDGYLEALLPEDEAPEGALVGIGALVDRLDLDRLPGLVAATRRAGAAVVPTMVLWESAIFPQQSAGELEAERTEVRYVLRAVREQWRSFVEQRSRASTPEANRRLAEVRRAVLRALHEGGVTILLGADTPQIFNVPGFALHREMASYLEVGMTPYQILVAATRRVAEHLGHVDAGTIAPGMRADLVLVDGNPLEELSRLRQPAGVMVRGRWLDAREIAERLAAIAASHAGDAATPDGP